MGRRRAGIDQGKSERIYIDIQLGNWRGRDCDSKGAKDNDVVQSVRIRGKFNERYILIQNETYHQISIDN